MLHLNPNVHAVTAPSGSADQNLDFILKILTRHEVSTTMLSSKMAQYFEMCQLKSGSLVKSISELNSILSDQLSNKHIDPLEKQIIQFILISPTAAHELGNFLHSDITVGNGTTVKNQVAGLLLMDAANNPKNPKQSDDSVLVGDAYVNGVISGSDVTNTVIIESADKSEGLNAALKYYQKAADLGHAGAAVKIEVITALLTQHLIAVAVLASEKTDNAAESALDKSAKKDRISRDAANHKAIVDRTEAQMKKISAEAASAAELQHSAAGAA